MYVYIINSFQPPKPIHHFLLHPMCVSRVGTRRDWAAQASRVATRRGRPPSHAPVARSRARLERGWAAQAVRRQRDNWACSINSKLWGFQPNI